MGEGIPVGAIEQLQFAQGAGDGNFYELSVVDARLKELRAEQWAPRRYSGMALEGELGGIRVNCVHAQSAGAIYPGTLLNRTAWFAAMAERAGKSADADVIVRSHTHSFGLGKFQDKWVLSTRCWKLPNNDYAVTRMEFFRAHALCDLGATILTIGPDGLTWSDHAYPPWKATHRKLA